MRVSIGLKVLLGLVLAPGLWLCPHPAGADGEALSSRVETGLSPCVDDLYSGVDSQGWQVYQGAIERVQIDSADSGGADKSVRFLLRTAQRSIWVELGPAWFLDRQEEALKKGDSVVVRGYYSSWDGQEEIVAARVDRGSKSLWLLNQDGTPVWCAWHYLKRP